MLVEEIFDSIILFHGLVFVMKTDEYSTQIDGKTITFYHNQTNHKMEIIIDFDLMNPYVVTLAKGKAIIAFLKALK